MINKCSHFSQFVFPLSTLKGSYGANILVEESKNQGRNLASKGIMMTRNSESVEVINVIWMVVRRLRCFFLVMEDQLPDA